LEQKSELVGFGEHLREAITIDVVFTNPPQGFRDLMAVCSDFHVYFGYFAIIVLIATLY
jgi:hypothetical protein